ncbi:Transcriptional regulatory protein LiaR [Acaryochloris thomasi RCC1774]|uniref:Transcriptional regulatory protein LiaR n=1 Tax=Acaryochloris thomasi RCC1774 TaxID=1764569 RepID=A0A2W1JPE4_9CYAN|nr:response regulator transcription factor [Acaryochloris thomasi]PZD73295.1 Transcriptional regulatory protein LiaR [Acaryochloris thomasi RCC1774]
MSKAIQLPKWRVLIVEDDPLVQLGLEQALVDYVELTVVGLVDDGYLAVEAILEKRPDLVLMDLGLPGLDGIEITQRVKEKLPDLKVVILTSHTSDEEVFAALSSGADAYCVKGGGIELLLTAIASVSQGSLYLDVKIAHTILQEMRSSPTVKLEHPLTEREFDVLRLLVEGLNNTEIAGRLYISPNTVKSHMRGLMSKLAVSDRVQVAVKALRAGLV